MCTSSLFFNNGFHICYREKLEFLVKLKKQKLDLIFRYKKGSKTKKLRVEITFISLIFKNQKLETRWLWNEASRIQKYFQNNPQRFLAEDLPSSIAMPRLISSDCLEWTSAHDNLMILSFLRSSEALSSASATSLSHPCNFQYAV